MNRQWLAFQIFYLPLNPNLWGNQYLNFLMHQKLPPLVISGFSYLFLFVQKLCGGRELYLHPVDAELKRL